MNQPETASRAEEVPPSRARLLRLLAANPNYFGTFPGIGFEPVETISDPTEYEELGCVSYSPETDRLEATIQLKRPTGYSGPLCSAGSFEHVRFWINYGSGWTDAGLASVNVHDIPEGRDCAGQDWHPISYVVGVDHDPRRRWCGSPVLPRVRAVLSWEIQPPAGPPPSAPEDWLPAWGDVKECAVQVRPRRFWFTDIGDLLGPKVAKELTAKLPPYLLSEPVPGSPDPGPLSGVPLPELAKLSAESDVPVHRYALPHLDAVQANLAPSPAAFATNAQALISAGIDIDSLVKALADTSGNTRYEELFCLGLDEGSSSLVATFMVKQPNGYSGGPCTPGSIEHIAFWADWDNDCRPTYLGTVQVRVHDYPKVDQGLCYAAVLPVNLGSLRRSCEKPRLSRVRAVLSWGTPPSTTDPDAVPTWGNWIDRHVQVAPGRPYDGTARFDHVGGVQAQNVSLTTGLTQFAGQPPQILDGSVVAVGAAFAGVVKFHGPADPFLAGTVYRLVGTAGAQVRVFTDTFTVFDSALGSNDVTPGADGSVTWQGFNQNKTGLLGQFNPGGDDLWTVRLELFVGGAWGPVADTATVRMDHTQDHQDLQLQTAAQCKIPAGPLDGTLTASDIHFGSWSIQVLGTNTMPVTPVDPVTAAVLPTWVPAPPPGTNFRIDLSAFQSCGYVVRLWLHENVVVNSYWPTRSTPVDRGICIE